MGRQCGWPFETLLFFFLTQFNLVLEELLREQCGLAAGRDEALELPLLEVV